MLDSRIKKLFQERLSRWGNKIDFYLPGMFTLYDEKGLYPAISITGKNCDLGCEHCKGNLLKDMLVAKNNDELIYLGMKLYNDGIKGILITGGCNDKGELPFENVIDGIEYLKKHTDLFISIHSGMNLKSDIAQQLKSAGVNQALLDIIVDDTTAKEIYNLPNTDIVKSTHQTLIDTGFDIIPHIVIGLYRGKIKGEYKAIDYLKEYKPKLVSLVIFMPSVAMKEYTPPPIDDVIDVMLYARENLPDIELSLGCARPKGKYRYKLEEIAIESGFTRIAIWSDVAIQKANELGLEIKLHKTCCSLPLR